MSAKKSPNRINVAINRNFIIRVLENYKENDVKNTKLTSANKLSLFLNDEKLKIKLFNKALHGTKQQYTFKIRNRLRIDFRAK